MKASLHAHAPTIVRNVPPRPVAFLLIVGLLATTTLTAQTAISNLGQTTYGGNYGVGSYSATINVGDAVSFTTGASAVDFTGVTLLLASSGTAQGSGFHVTLNSGFNSAGTTGLLATLNGNAAPAPGATPTTFLYAAAAPLTLAANTTYWVQVDAFSTPTSTNFSWANTDSSAPLDAGGLAGWSYDTTTFYFSNNGGSIWSPTAVGTKFPQLAVHYSAVPEPATATIWLGLAAAGLIGWRRLRRG